MECEEFLQELKDILSSAPMLKAHYFRKPFQLHTDVSGRGVGAVLSQVDDDGEDHPVTYFSGKLLPREKHYSNIEECLAIKLGI